MHPRAGVATRQVAIDAFYSVLESQRLAASIAFGSARSAARELDRASAAVYQASAERNQLTVAASVEERVAAEIEVDRWRQYVTTHLALALQGALVVFNAVDLALKDYVRIRHGAQDRRWIVGGPAFGATPRSLFEVVRAICNYFRHRDEWLAGTGLAQARRSMIVLQDLGISPLSSSAHVIVLQLMPFDTWLDLESAIVAAISGIA